MPSAVCEFLFKPCLLRCGGYNQMAFGMGLWVMCSVLGLAEMALQRGCVRKEIGVVAAWRSLICRHWQHSAALQTFATALS